MDQKLDGEAIHSGTKPIQSQRTEDAEAGHVTNRGARSRQYLVLRTFAELLIRLTVQSKGCRASEPGKLLRSNARDLAVDGGSIGHTADDTREPQGPWLLLC